MSLTFVTDSPPLTPSHDHVTDLSCNNELHLNLNVNKKMNICHAQIRRRSRPNSKPHDATGTEKKPRRDEWLRPKLRIRCCPLLMFCFPCCPTKLEEDDFEEENCHGNMKNTMCSLRSIQRIEKRHFLRKMCVFRIEWRSQLILFHGKCFFFFLQQSLRLDKLKDKSHCFHSAVSKQRSRHKHFKEEPKPELTPKHSLNHYARLPQRQQLSFECVIAPRACRNVDSPPHTVKLSALTPSKPHSYKYHDYYFILGSETGLLWRRRPPQQEHTGVTSPNVTGTFLKVTRVTGHSQSQSRKAKTSGRAGKGYGSPQRPKEFRCSMETFISMKIDPFAPNVCMWVNQCAFHIRVCVLFLLTCLSRLSSIDCMLMS